MPLLPSSKFGAEGRLGLGDDLIIFFLESGLVGMESVCGGLPRVLRAVLSMRTPVSAACRNAGHVLEAVADPGCCSIWPVHSHPLSPRAFPPYAGVTCVFGVKGP